MKATRETLKKAVGTKVYLRDLADEGAVTYHGTPVVAWTPTEIVLNTGGWFTATTKRRMNQASSTFHLEFYVSQENFAWSANHKGKVYDFKGDVLVIPR